VVEVCLRELTSPDVELFFSTAWFLWCARNELVWEGKNSLVTDICCRASVLAFEFLEVDGVESPSHGDGVGNSLLWTPPPPGCYKMSVACHLLPSSAKVGIGVIIRDCTGWVAAAAGFVLGSPSDHLSRFAYAVFYAMQFAYETGFRCNIEVEVPSREVLNLLKFDSPCLAPCGDLIDDIGAWLPFYTKVVFSFISIDCNKAAQALATEAASSNLDCVWLEECPPCIQSFV
jgi:hypothetical protein